MKRQALYLAVAVLMLAATRLPAQQGGPKHNLILKEAQPGLVSLATVSVDTARRVALRSQRGRVVSERLEKRGNQVVYVFGIQSGRSVHRVIIDARNGTVVKAQAHDGTSQTRLKSLSRKG